MKRGTGLYRRAFTLAELVENAWIVVDGMGLRAQFAVDGRPAGGVRAHVHLGRGGGHGRAGPAVCAVGEDFV